MTNNDNNSKLIGKRIKESRKNANMTQSELGKALGNLSYQMIGQYETGARKPKRERIEEIAKILDVNPKYLTGESNKPKGSFVIVKKDGSKEYIDTSKIAAAANLAFENSKFSSDWELVTEGSSEQLLSFISDSSKSGDSLPERSKIIKPYLYKDELLSTLSQLNREGWKELTKYAKYLVTNPKYQIDSESHEPTEEK